MAKKVGIPYASEKPTDKDGFFSVIWHRFFVSLYKEIMNVSDLEVKEAFSSSGQDSSGQISDVELQEAFSQTSKDNTQRLDDLELLTIFNQTSKNYTGRVTKELWLNIAGLKASGAKPATEVAHGLDTAWQFANAIAANQESITGRIITPDDIDRSIAPIGIIGWSADGANPGNCKWQVEYVWSALNENTTAAAQETLTEVSTASATANGLITADFTGINVPGATDRCITFRITRLSGDAEDTIADTVEMVGVCLSYTRKTKGIVS